jgi:hypothetical protein
MSEIRFATFGRFRSSASSTIAATPSARSSSSSTKLNNHCSKVARIPSRLTHQMPVRAKYRDISIGARCREVENQGLMQGANKDKWLQLCAQAAVEQNPRRLLELTTQINELLSGKQSRLESQAAVRNEK